METVYRQIAFHRLNDTQKQAKLQKDSEYEIAAQNLTVAFVQKKRTVGVTPKEEDRFKHEKHMLWHEYKDWAIDNGLYEEVTPEQQLTEAENGLNAQVDKINLIRTELKKPLLEVKEKFVIEEL